MLASQPARHRRLGAGWHEDGGLCGQIRKERDATGYGVRNVAKAAGELCGSSGRGGDPPEGPARGSGVICEPCRVSAPKT